MTPQARSLQYLRDHGFTAETTERWKRFPSKTSQPCATCGERRQVQLRQDLFGFADIIAFNGTNVVLVQCTTRENMSHRWAKIRELEDARKWVGVEGVGNTERLLLILGWYKKDNRWQVKEKLVVPHDFEVTRCADWDNWDEEQPELPF